VIAEDSGADISRNDHESQTKAAEEGDWSLSCSLRPHVKDGNFSHIGPDILQVFQCKENGISLRVSSHKSLVEPGGQKY
jgi:hypothetical protein